MKKVLISLMLVPFFFACTPAVKKGADLSGKVANLSAGFFILGGPVGAKDSIKLDANGRFTYVIPGLTKPSNYYLLVGPDYMPFKLTPGMKLEINFDANAFKSSLKFAGKGSDFNNYLVAKSIATGDMDYEIYKLEPGPFKLKQDSLLAIQKKLLAETAKDDANDPFWKTAEADMIYGWAGSMSMFESYHAYFGKLEGYKVPEEFNAYKNQLDVNQPAYVGSDAFKSYVNNFVREAAGKKVDALKLADSTQTINSTKIRRETAVELLKNEVVLAHYLFDDVSGMVQWKDIDGEVQEAIDYFVSTCKDTALVSELNKTVNEWKALGLGQPAFEFSGKDMQGNTVKLSDFKGKLVYVDVWATWCGPCKYEIPYLDTLETDYHGKNIVFISYSIDEDHDAWMKFVPENKLQGVQIIGEKAWESALCKNYKIMGVPTFMLFDTEGKIVSVKMTRPSDKKTREKFDSLL